MKQIIYLGGKKAREYDGVDEPKQYGLYEKFVIRENAYHAHISALPIVDVIGDCDWKEGEVKTKGVDYKVMRYARREMEDGTLVDDPRGKWIVPIPKKQEGEEELDEFKLLCMIQNEFREIEKLSFSEAHKRKLEMLTYFTITRKS